MHFNNLLGDVVNRINSGNRHRVKNVELRANKSTMELLFVLQELGLIKGFKIINKHKIIVTLRYYRGHQIFFKLNLVSKPSKRIYWSMHRLYKEVDKQNSLIYVISTKQGLFLGSECI